MHTLITKVVVQKRFVFTVSFLIAEVFLAWSSNELLKLYKNLIHKKGGRFFGISIFILSKFFSVSCNNIVEQPAFLELFGIHDFNCGKGVFFLFNSIYFYNDDNDMNNHRVSSDVTLQKTYESDTNIYYINQLILNQCKLSNYINLILSVL